MSAEDPNKLNRRRFLKTIGGAAMAGVAAGQIANVVEKATAPYRRANVSKAEQVNELTHYGEGVSDVLNRNLDRIYFEPASGSLRVFNGQLLIGQKRVGGNEPRIRSISLTISDDDHILTIRYSYDKGGDDVIIKNIPGDLLEVETLGWSR